MLHTAQGTPCICFTNAQENFKLHFKQQIFIPDNFHIMIASKTNRYLKTKTLTYIAMKVHHIGRILQCLLYSNL